MGMNIPFGLTNFFLLLAIIIHFCKKTNAELSIIYIITIAIGYIVSLLAIFWYNPEVLNERVKNIKINTKSWDKIFLCLYAIFTFVITNIFIGLDIIRYEWSHIGINYCYIGFALYFFSIVINIKSLIENKFFESSSRIQTKRNQTVISTRVYSVVRHPGYSSIVVWLCQSPYSPEHNTHL